MFNEEKVTDEIINFIRNYYKKNNLKGVVIGVSGGKDSAAVAALFCRALGSENVLGLWLPCHSSNTDKEDAYLLAHTLNFNIIDHDLTDIYDNYVSKIRENDNLLIDANINIKPRLRMMTLYYYASMYTKKEKGTYLVAGTSNKCERYVGYFTKGGDNVCDISVIANLTVSEIIKLSKYLGIPEKIYNKCPNDGLSGYSDEEKLGVKYTDIETYIYEEEHNLSSSLNKEVYDKIKKLHERNIHKFIIPIYGSKE